MESASQQFLLLCILEKGSLPAVKKTEFQKELITKDMLRIFLFNSKKLVADLLNTSMVISK